MIQPSLTDERYLKQLLGRAGVHPARCAGQNFLISEEVIEATLLALQDGPERVTELGAGIGTLTLPLAAAGFAVRAIERDKALAQVLHQQLPKKFQERVEIISQDLRETDWSWEKSYQLVGNIPYNLSGLIIRRITQLAPTPERVALLVQAEVGERLCAQPGEMSLLSLAVQLWGSAEKLLSVPPSCFWPQPQVTSQLVFLQPHTSGLSLPERENILKIAKPFFQAKRKQMGGGLRHRYDVTEAGAAAWLAAIGATVQARPQELSPTQWQMLAKEIY